MLEGVLAPGTEGIRGVVEEFTVVRSRVRPETSFAGCRGLASEEPTKAVAMDVAGGAAERRGVMVAGHKMLSAYRVYSE